MIDDEFEYPLFPMGLISLASFLKKRHRVGVVNLVLEKALRGDRFDLKSFLRSFESKIVAIDLHWWVHSFDSIELARMCKEINPNCLVVLGGLTSSYFAAEIVRDFPFIDVVVRGDGEEPISVLADSFLEGKSIRHVPNSVVREDGRIYVNDISYVADSLDVFDFTDVSLLSHWEEHLWLHSRPTNYDPSRGDTVFSPWLCIARGCPFNCSFCGGTREAHWLCSKRSGVTLRSPEKVVEDIAFLADIGVRTINFSHGPALVGEKHFFKILDLLRRERIDVNGFMELWQLPSAEFMNGLRKSFSDLSFRVVIGSGSEKVRQFNRGISVSNRDFLKLLDVCRRVGVECFVDFLANLPSETADTFMETLDLMRKLVREKSITNIFFGSCCLEPASPIFLHPKKFGVIADVSDFSSFYSLMRKPHLLPYYLPSGYHTEAMSEADVRALIEVANEKLAELTLSLNTMPANYSFL